MPPTSIPTATGSHTRVQMQRSSQALIPHGTVQTYDPQTGSFTAFMDFQPSGEAAYQFTPLDGEKGKFTDQNLLVWVLVG